MPTKRENTAADLLTQAREALPELRAVQAKIDEVRAREIAEHGTENADLVDAALEAEREKARSSFHSVVRAVSKAGLHGACQHPTDTLEEAISAYYDGSKERAFDLLEDAAGGMQTEANSDTFSQALHSRSGIPGTNGHSL